MLHHIPGQSAFDLSWRGEYYDACVLFARSNDAEMKQNKCSVEQLMQATPSNYYNGTALWRKAQDCKRLLLNEIHTVFCQEVCRQWPTLPSGTTTLDPLMLELRNVLWTKKAQELKDGRVARADAKVQEAKKVHDAVEMVMLLRWSWRFSSSV